LRDARRPRTLQSNLGHVERMAHCGARLLRIVVGFSRPHCGARTHHGSHAAGYKRAIRWLLLHPPPLDIC